MFQNQHLARNVFGDKISQKLRNMEAISNQYVVCFLDKVAQKGNVSLDSRSSGR